METEETEPFTALLCKLQYLIRIFDQSFIILQNVSDEACTDEIGKRMAQLSAGFVRGVPFKLLEDSFTAFEKAILKSSMSLVETARTLPHKYENTLDIYINSKHGDSYSDFESDLDTFCRFWLDFRRDAFLLFASQKDNLLDDDFLMFFGNLNECEKWIFCYVQLLRNWNWYATKL